MSNLDISSATIGVDKAKMATAVENLKIEVIGAAKTKMDSNFDALENSVRKVWTGTSADTYIANMAVDKEHVKNALSDIENTLENYFENIRTRIHQIDNNLVESRDGSSSVLTSSGIGAGSDVGSSVFQSELIGGESPDMLNYSGPSSDLNDYIK